MDIRRLELVSQQSRQLFGRLRQEFPTLITEDDPEHPVLRIPGYPARFDACLPQRKVLIEYDGAFWHANKVRTDTAKSQVAINAGYTLVRIRQAPLERITELDVIVPSRFDADSYACLVVAHLNRVLES